MARPQKTSFNVATVPVAKFGSAYTHQKPEHRAKLGYIHSDRSHLNESWHKEYQANGHPKTLRNYLADTKKVVKEKTGRAMQKRAEDNVISEAVVVIDEQTTMKDLHKLGKEMESRFGWSCVQIHIHRDEGYLGERVEEMKHREGKYNLHAHMFFITTNLSNGKSWKRRKFDGSEMQDITAKALNLTRGTRKSERKEQVKETLNVIEFKEAQAQANIEAKRQEKETIGREIEQAKEELRIAEEEVKKGEIKRKENEFVANREKEWWERELKELQEEIVQKREERESEEKRLDFAVKKVKEMEGVVGTLEQKERKLEQNISELEEVKREGEEELKELQEEIVQKRVERESEEKRLDFAVKKVKELDGVVGTLKEKERKLEQNISELEEVEREKRDTIDLLDNQIRIKDEFLATRDEEIEKRGEEILPIEKFREIDDLSADSYDIACQAYQYGISTDATKKLIDGEEVEIGSIRGEPFPYGPIKVKVQRSFERPPDIVGYFQDKWQTLKSIYQKVKEMVTKFINYRASDTKKKAINLQERGKERGRSI